MTSLIGAMPKLVAQIEPRTKIPVFVAAGNSTGYYQERAQGLRYYREAYETGCVQVVGIYYSCPEDVFLPDVKLVWS